MMLILAVRGGGHNGAGLGSCDGRPGHRSLADARHSTWIRPREVRVEGGCTWGDVDHATYPFGLAVPTGFISTTGVGGLTLGGGVGYLTRRYGLTIDNLLGVDMVLADGSFVTANAARILTCSGPCAAVAAISASSPPSCSAVTQSVQPSMAGRSSGRWNTPAR
jgi:FAD/FMN-containing dehydrogenase